MGLRWAYTFLAVAAMTAGAVVGGGYNGFPAEDFVDKLPGQPNVTFRQYAGYVDVNATSGKSFFYYFVEAQINPNQSPLTLWFNGGPGCSSIGGGAFTELGPFSPTGDGRGLVVNPDSWNRVSNLLFVEFPVGVGWSYSNTSSDYSTGDEATATDTLNFLFEWYNKFPSFRSRDLFLAGESYAGHYTPQLALRLLNHNAQNDSHPFNLKGIALGNPTLKVDRDVPAMYEFFWSHGIISDEVYINITNQCDFRYYSKGPISNLTLIPCLDSLKEAFGMIGTDYADIYGVIYDKCYPAIVEQELRLGKMATKTSFGVDVCKLSETSFYLNLPEVQKALHANRTKLPYDWSDCSSIVKYTVKDQDINMLPTLKAILESKIRIWIYSGDQDAVVPLAGTRKIAREVAEELKLDISVPYGPWFHQGQVAGWRIEYGNLLTFATVKGGAHMLPYSQPSRALNLFTNFVLGLRLPNTTSIN